MRCCTVTITLILIIVIVVLLLLYKNISTVENVASALATFIHQVIK